MKLRRARHFRWISMLAASLIASSFASRAFAQATTEPAETARAFVKDQQEALQQIRNESPATPAKPIDSLVTLDLNGGRLVATIVDAAGPDEMQFALPDEPDTAVRLSVRHLATPTPVTVFNLHVMKLDTTASRALNVELLPLARRGQFFGDDRIGGGRHDDGTDGGAGGERQRRP